LGSLAYELDYYVKSLNAFYRGLILQSELKGCLHISLSDPLFKMGVIYFKYGLNKLALEHI